MASPVVESQSPAAASNATGGATTTGHTAANSHAVVLPATVSVGATLIVAGRVMGAGAVGFPGGWTLSQDSSDASDDVSFWAFLNTGAVGNEDGTSITVTHGATLRMSAIAVSITGAADPAVRPPEAAGPGILTTATAFGGPNLVPTGGAKDYLWLATAGADGEHSYSTAAPATYTAIAFGTVGTAGAVTLNGSAAMARKAANAASENPGDFVITVAPSASACYTIAVHPAAAATPSLVYQPAPSSLYLR